MQTEPWISAESTIENTEPNPKPVNYRIAIVQLLKIPRIPA